MGRGRKSVRKRQWRDFFPPFSPPGGSRPRLLAWLLCGIAATYLLTFSTVPITTFDDQVMLSSATNLLHTGKLVLPERYGDRLLSGDSFGQRSLSGDIRSQYPAGYPVVLAVFLFVCDLAGSLAGPLAAESVLCLPSMLALLVTCFLLWRTSLRLGFAPGAAACVVAAFGVGSYAWPYAGINFSEPWQVMCLAGAIYGLVAARGMEAERPRRSYLLVSGLCLGYAILTKVTLAWFMPILAAGAVFGWKDRSLSRSAVLRAVLLCAPGCLVFASLLVANRLLAGSFLDFGYQRGFTNPMGSGLAGLIVSGRKSIFLFFPLAVLFPLGAWRLARAGNAWAAGILAAFPTYVPLIAKWSAFEGGQCWGPRLIMPVLPALALLSGAALRGRWTLRAGWALALAGFVLNAPGALISYQAFYSIARSTGRNYADYQEDVAQIPGHFWLLAVELTTPVSASTESGNPLWARPPWIRRYPEAIPFPFPNAPDPAIWNPWVVRAALPAARWRRSEWWSVRMLLEVAVARFGQKDRISALALLDQGLAIDPANKQCLAAKGMVLHSVGNLTGALELYDRSLAADPDYNLAAYGRGQVLEAMGNAQAAAQMYRRVLELPPGTLDLASVRARLERLTRAKLPPEEVRERAPGGKLSSDPSDPRKRTPGTRANF